MKRLVFLTTYKRILQILPEKLKRKFWLMLLLILITSMVDILGLAIFIPIISAIVDPSLLKGDHILARIKDFSNIQQDNTFLLSIFLAGFVFLLLRSVFIVMSQHFQAKFVFRLSQYVVERAYTYYLYLPYEEFSKLETSRVITELTISPQHFSRFLVMPLLLLSSEILMITLIICGIAVYNIEVFVLLVLTVVPAVFLFQLLVRKRMQRYGKIQHDYTRSLHSHSNRGINGFIDVKLRNKEYSLIADYISSFKVLSNVSVRTSVLNIVPAKLFELATIGGLLVIFIYATYWTSTPELVLPLISLYAAAGYRIIPSLSKIVPALMQLEQYHYLFDVYKEALQTDIKELSAEFPAKRTLPFNESIELKRVSFKFKDELKPLFQNINLTIKKGEVVGLIGRSGSGKTSLVNLITGFLTPGSGAVLIDGVELNSQNLDAWRSNISYVQQSPYLEKGTLTSNIAFLEKNVDEERLKFAIEGASLTDFAAGRNANEVMIEEGGKNLSGGQKQRVIIARALYHRSSLIVLDEATSALDNETEDSVNETIRKLRNFSISIIIIAHRYSTLKHTDRIIKMTEGKIESLMQYGDIVSE